MRKLLKKRVLEKTLLAVQRMMAPGATLNARSEVERAAQKVTELDAQLRRVAPATSTTSAKAPTTTNAA